LVWAALERLLLLPRALEQVLPHALRLLPQPQ
jgi:hypothetical protein